MKTTINKKENFVPCSITIHFESQKELNALTTLFNYGPVNSALGKEFDVSAKHLIEVLESLGGDPHLVSNFDKHYKKIL